MKYETAGQISRTRDRIADLSQPLNIDDEIRRLHGATGRRLGLTPHWTLERALQFGRLALEVAYAAKLDGDEEHKKSEALALWKLGEKRAAKARDGLRFLLEYLSPTDKALTNTDALTWPLFKKAAQENPSAGPSEILPIAREQAGSLLAAMAVLEGMSEHMTRNRKIMALTVQNPGCPERAWFLFRMAEAWIYLVGKLPGHIKGHEQSPFLKLVTAGWVDIGGNEDAPFGDLVRPALDGRGPLATTPQRLAVSDEPPFWAQGFW